MEQRQFDQVTATETLFGTRRGLDSFDRISSGEESVSRAREKLNLGDRPAPIPDDRQYASRTLYPDRAETSFEPAQDHFEAAVTDEPEIRRNHLFFGTGTEFVPTEQQGVDVNDLKPSGKTMQYQSDEVASMETYFDRYDFEDAPTVSPAPAIERKPLTRRAKLTIALYSGIIAVVSALIILTGALIGSVTADIASLEGELAVRQSALAATNEQLELVSDPEYLAGSAADLGMVDAGAGVTVDLLPVVDTAETAHEGNSFDRFCDWLGKVFG